MRIVIIFIFFIILISCSSTSQHFFLKKNIDGITVKHGFWVENSDNGTCIIEFKNGKKNGIYYCFYPDGTKKVFGKYKNEIETGKWYFYDEKGRVQKILGHNKKGESYVIQLNNLVW